VFLEKTGYPPEGKFLYFSGNEKSLNIKRFEGGAPWPSYPRRRFSAATRIMTQSVRPPLEMAFDVWTTLALCALSRIGLES